MKKIIEQLKEKSKKIKDDLFIIYYSYQNPRLKILPKIFLFLILAYLLSPIDIIPDFIPVLGSVDEIIIIPFLILIAFRLIPPEIIQEAKEKISKEKIQLKKNWFLIVLLIIFSMLILILIILSKIKNHNSTL